MALKKKYKLDRPPPGPKPAYVMPEPNADAEAYGWSLGKLREPSDDSTPGNIWPGRGIFSVPMPLEAKYVYGMDVQFIDTGFVQALLDATPEVRKGAEKVKAAGYTKEALNKFGALIDKVFAEKIMPEIQARFSKVSTTVAEFYAARLAYIEKFGVDDGSQEEDKAEKPKRRGRPKRQTEERPAADEESAGEE